MKFSMVSVGLLALLTPLTAAWSKEDREIFRVRDELSAAEGPDVTFYEYLGITPSANQDEIGKAYKKKSKLLHPDKVRQQLMAERTKENKAKGKTGAVKPPTKAELKAAVRSASDRQSRLSIVADVLRGPGRARYDHFLNNGFPLWKGTDYYYNRYRPGFGTVLVGCLLVMGGGFHYVALYMSWKRQREFVERYIKFARRAAWGDNLSIPGVEAATTETPPAPASGDEEQPQMPMNRKQRRFQEQQTRKESGAGAKKVPRGRVRGSAPASGSATPVPQPEGSGPTGAKKRVVAENGKVLVVDSLGDVYLEQADEDGNVMAFLLDPTELAKPTIKDTALVRLPVWAFRSTVGRFTGSKTNGEDEDLDDIVDEDSSSSPGQRTPSADSTEDFELLDKSIEDLSKSKTSGSQAQSGKSKKRNNNKKR
ncbi:DnaJ domain or J-domain-containing protein [Microdochium bolleyi]|uniref:DnaJ domain or J-domain-containing protein n=1 Tax=Microdochium bolleyi TaxID=196109 RepID=A0A136J2R6_9PEZI|nr:DnaJ domain or J-domain-containing protein [Microdochium bolleyi]